MNAINRFGLAALSATLLGTAVYSYAAPPNDPPPRDEQCITDHPDHPHSRGHKGMMMLHKLKLSDAQKQQLIQIRAAQKPAFEEKRQALRQAHEALQALTDQANADLGKVRALANAQGQAMADISVLRAEFKQKLIAILTPEQQQQLQQLGKDRKNRRHSRFGKPAEM